MKQRPEVQAQFEQPSSAAAPPRLGVWHPDSMSARLGARRSLRVNIGMAFSVLIALLGVGLITFAYERHRQIALLTADELFAQNTAQVADHVSALYAPAETLVNMSTALAETARDLFSDREALFAFLVEALGRHPNIEAAYVGYGDGDFVLARDTHDALGLRYLGIAMPAGTRFIEQTIERDDGQPPRYENTYYNVSLEPLGTGAALLDGYDPREREWYRLASKSPTLEQTDFYTFFTTRETGTTIARQVAGTSMVFGVDITLESVSTALRRLTTTDSSEVIVFAADGKLLGSNDASRLSRLIEPGGSGRSARGSARTFTERGVQAGIPRQGAHLNDFEEPVLDALYEQFLSGNHDAATSVDIGDQHWFTAIRPVSFGSDGESAFMAIAVPEAEMLSTLGRVRLESALLAVVALGLAVLVAWWLSHSLAASTTRLATEAREMSLLRFDAPITVSSRITEIDALARSMSVMKSALQRFTRVATALSAQEGTEGVARVALAEAQAGCRAGSARLLLLSDDGRWLETLTQSAGDPAPPDDERIAVPRHDGGERQTAPEIVALKSGKTVISDDSRSVQIPLKAGNEPPFGVLQLDAAAHQMMLVDEERVRFVEALAAAAAVALRNRQLIEAQRDTFDSLIRLLAAAIDAKSPYTGRHCQRVPVLTERLAQAADASQAPAFRHFRLDERTARELHVASWLHDCGKVTTPEYVVDKATKLETIHNRIHEIRTRFEVLWRDAEIDYLRTTRDLPRTQHESAIHKLHTTRSELQADFAFLASCNIASEAMTAASRERVRTIAAHTWLRNFDATLGLSRAELERQDTVAPASLPVRENLLADRPEHRTARQPTSEAQARARPGFSSQAPTHQHDRGEIHNLTIAYGTLTEEERYTIKDHVHQTIRMLDDIPFPRDLARVPRIAGNHHEKLDGSGYPRGLKGADLEIEDRIMAIADVFEALTARDRPYRKAKSLSESLGIMQTMSDRGLICPDLFELFVRERVHLHYAAEHLAAEQIDLPMPLDLARSGALNEME